MLMPCTELRASGNPYFCKSHADAWQELMAGIINLMPEHDKMTYAQVDQFGRVAPTS